MIKVRNEKAFKIGIQFLDCLCYKYKRKYRFQLLKVVVLLVFFLCVLDFLSLLLLFIVASVAIFLVSTSFFVLTAREGRVKDLPWEWLWSDCLHVIEGFCCSPFSPRQVDVGLWKYAVSCTGQVDVIFIWLRVDQTHVVRGRCKQTVRWKNGYMHMVIITLYWAIFVKYFMPDPCQVNTT